MSEVTPPSPIAFRLPEYYLPAQLAIRQVKSATEEQPAPLAIDPSAGFMLDTYA